MIVIIFCVCMGGVQIKMLLINKQIFKICFAAADVLVNVRKTDNRILNASIISRSFKKSFYILSRYDFSRLFNMILNVFENLIIRLMYKSRQHMHSFF